MSADGGVVVGSGRQEDGLRAFVWTADGGLRRLDEVLATDFGVDTTGWTLHQALGISADGRVIVGTGTNPDGVGEAWIAVLPEPSTALLGIASAALLFVGRRGGNGSR